MTNPRDDLMALATALKNANWPNVSIGNKALLRKAIECLTEVAQRPATQVVDREAVARALCESGKFETGEGTCSLLCMDQLGSVRKKGCNHLTRVHGKLVDSILSLLRPAEPTSPDAVGEPVAWRIRKADGGCTRWFDGKPPGHGGRYEVAYTHPPKSPDTSAALLQRALEQALNSLAEIAAAHIPDCPAHYAGDELSWAQRHIGSLRHKAEIARDGIAAAIRTGTERGDES